MPDHSTDSVSSALPMNQRRRLYRRLGGDSRHLVTLGPQSYNSTRNFNLTLKYDALACVDDEGCFYAAREWVSENLNRLFFGFH